MTNLNDNFNLSDKGLNTLKSLEGLKLFPYDDQTGKKIQRWVRGATIGYGYLILPTEWEKYRSGVTIEEAEKLLKTSLCKYARGVRIAIDVPIHQYEYDALVIFAYNIGLAAFYSSSTVKIINGYKSQTPFNSLEEAWKAFNKSQGKVSKGLQNRRSIEWKIYQSGEYQI